MEELKLLLKYSFKNKSRPKNKGLFKSNNTSSISNVFLYMLPALIFGFMLITSLTPIFKYTNIPIYENSKITIADTIVSLYFLIMSIMFVLQYSSTIVTSLFENDNLILLLTFPIKKSSIFLSSAIESFVLSSINLGMLLAVIISYLIANPNNIFLSIISSVLFIVMLISLGLLIGMIISLFIGKTAAKRTAQIIYFMGIIVFVLVINLFSNSDIQKINNSFSPIIDKADIILNPIWPHAHLLNAFHGNINSSLIILSILIISTIFLIIYLNKIELNISNKKNKHKDMKIKVSKFTLLKKEFKLLFRNSSIFFMIIYPLILPLIFIITGNIENISLNIFFIVFSALYSAYISIYSIIEDYNIWPLPILIPLKYNKQIKIKSIISSFIYILEYIIFIIIISFMKGFSIYNIIMIIPVSLILYFSSLWGTKMFINDPHRDTSNKNNILKFGESIKIQISMVLISLSIFLPSSYIEKIINGSISLNIYITLLLILIPIIVITMLLIFSKKLIISIDKLIQKNLY
ncbi:hypothetical protein [Oceanotoga teriensis]|jgi:ABC-2 type transport system permease protein|uniref:hypothetical protein n=1 Tax=Oceanotoga teriensis TaxID=515440 RepID=UPI002713B063|nr:hypothetical protein [Oceanotoga teriensis]MDO7976328.1 hypothetical protein [Oceanotoga teriensis]